MGFFRTARPTRSLHVEQLQIHLDIIIVHNGRVMFYWQIVRIVCIDYSELAPFEG